MLTSVFHCGQSRRIPYDSVPHSLLAAKGRYLSYLRAIFRFFSLHGGDTLHQWGWNLARSGPALYAARSAAGKCGKEWYGTTLAVLESI